MDAQGLSQQDVAAVSRGVVEEIMPTLQEAIKTSVQLAIVEAMPALQAMQQHVPAANVSLPPVQPQPVESDVDDYDGKLS
jgi:hypothetical protein